MPTLKVHRRESEYFLGVDLTKAREELGLTEAEFAEKCNWSQQNQQQLELPGVEHHLSFKKKEIFTRLGITFT